MKTLWLWLVYFWWAKVRRRPACPPNCKLCEVQRRIEAHYDNCPTCQGPDFPCEGMVPLQEEEENVTEELFPWTKGYANGTASSVPVQVFSPWDWSAK